MLYYFRLTSRWGAVLFALSLGLSTLAPFGIFAAPVLGDSMIYPTFRFYRGGAYASVTETTLARVFEERLTGAPRSRDLSRRLASHLYHLCLQHRFDPALILSVIQVESGFRADVVSSAGAIGLMQLMPDTARSLTAQPISAPTLRDPFLNLTVGVAYLGKLRDRYSGLSAYYPLAAYNLGPYRLDRLRANPGFKPDKTLRYYQDIMRGIGDWRRYGSQTFGEVSTIPRQRSALKTKPDVQAKLTDPA